MKQTGFENGNIVPIGTFALKSGWPQMPSEDRRRDERVHPILVTGLADSAMQSYLEAAYLERLRKRRDRAARLSALTSE